MPLSHGKPSGSGLIQMYSDSTLAGLLLTSSPVLCAGGSAKRRKLEAGGSLPERIGAELERSLRDFVALATVSRDPAYREDCFRGAKFLGTLLESLGAPLSL